MSNWGALARFQTACATMEAVLAPNSGTVLAFVSSAVCLRERKSWRMLTLLQYCSADLRAQRDRKESTPSLWIRNPVSIIATCKPCNKLWRAPSRLYRSRFLHISTHFAACFSRSTIFTHFCTAPISKYSQCLTSSSTKCWTNVIKACQFQSNQFATCWAKSHQSFVKN